MTIEHANSSFVILSEAKDLHRAGRAKGRRGLRAALRQRSFPPRALRMTMGVRRDT